MDFFKARLKLIVGDVTLVSSSDGIVPDFK